MEIKNNHHYVWAHYLRNWSENKRDIFHVTPKGKFVHHSIKDLAVRRHFYKSQRITAEHAQIIQSLSEKANSFMRSRHERALRSYMKIQMLESVMLSGDQPDPKAEKLIYGLNCNFMEELHGMYERSVSGLLPSLCNGNIEPLQYDDNLMKLLVFIGHQCSRTSSFKENFLAVLDDADRSKFEECWWFISYMLGMNIGAGLFFTKEHRRICLVHNTSQINFITSDHPITNIHESASDDAWQAPTHMDLYYPVSPKYALLISESENIPAGVSDVEENFVHDMNNRISKEAEITIFGLNEEDIKPYKRNIGHKLRRTREHFAR